MPKGRMLLKKISNDEKVAKLSLKAKLLYTWCIPHLDIEGRIYADSCILKGTVIPWVKEIDESDINPCCLEMEKDGLILLYGNDHKYMQFIGFKKNQKLNPDRESKSEIPTPDQLMSNSNKTLPNISKVKLSKVNIKGKPILSNDKIQKGVNPNGIFHYNKEGKLE